jgi:cyclopropane fatty-acyl-phospholipid synthase-like methyltransferase
MRQDERRPFVEALEQARGSAFAPGEYVGQESFMCASQIRELADRAGVASGVSVLDLCCGVGGPGLLLVRERGCAYLGVDASATAIQIATRRFAGTDAQFQVMQVPPLPSGRFDVVLLIETMLAFADKQALLTSVSAGLSQGGRFAFTFEEGRPLTPAEAELMPDADTVWLTPLDEMLTNLADVGLSVQWTQDWSASHRHNAKALQESFSKLATDITSVIGDQALTELVSAHQLWVDWIASGRVRKFAVVAEKV